MTDLLWNDAEKDAPVFLFAHGAGAPMDSDFMKAVAELLAERGVSVARFEFPYMASRRGGGKKRPPDRQPRLLEAFREAAAEAGGLHRVFLGGKSMGGRMATLLAAEEPCRGVVCFGYPFHPPGKPERLRTEHLETMTVPTLICQGERDPFGRREEVAGYQLSPAITLHWLEDGDHDLKPRKASGRTHEQNLREAVEAAAKAVKRWHHCG